MSVKTLSFPMNSAEQTAQFAARLAPMLSDGDVILLHGDVGAGKTHFARALIQSRLESVEDVPSPTFTLVQTYPLANHDIWHADLYRLSSTQEIEELGLLDAFETDICLIEWPDRLGDLTPPNALDLAFTTGPDEDNRILTATWTDPRWFEMLRECQE